MSTVFLDPAAMDATASAVSSHASEAQAAILGLESLGVASAPPALAGWIAAELGEVALTLRMAALLYLVAALDTMTRAESIRADQSLVTATPTLAGTAAAFPGTGFVLGAVQRAADPFTSAPATGGFLLGQAQAPSYVPSAGLQAGFLLGASGPNTPLGGYTPALGGSSSIGDIAGYHDGNLWTLSDETKGVTWVGANTYEQGGRTGTFDQVRPDRDDR